MPLGAIGEAVLQPVLEFVAELVGYFTGRVVVPLLTFGRVQVEPGRKGEWTVPKWHGVNRLPDGSYLLTAEMGALMGILFWVVVAICYTGYKLAT